MAAPSVSGQQAGTPDVSAQHTPGPTTMSPERTYGQWRELHALNGLAMPREWHELSEARQRVWRSIERSIFEAGMQAALAKAIGSAA
ncbi:hypothetical protein [Variovorax sp. W6]|uniref:hypothetical protein n=1 Tax=Variovorax sp. W6 TaxID=3093895 RepID=UPI003D80551C